MEDSCFYVLVKTYLAKMAVDVEKTIEINSYSLTQSYAKFSEENNGLK